jgi:methylmalonyl-CoA mutase
MAAVQGGTQSLHTNSYDEAVGKFISTLRQAVMPQIPTDISNACSIALLSRPIVGLPTDQSARVARNTQLILQEETGICDVADPWGGSYMMEALTDELYEKAKAIIKQVEEKGGMTSFINNGHAKLMIEESATKKQGRIDSGADTVVGVNKYRLSAEDEQAERVDVLQIDNSEVRVKQIARMNEVKASRDEALAQEALAKLEASARKTTSTSSGDDPDNLMNLCIECARVRYVWKLPLCLILFFDHALFPAY